MYSSAGNPTCEAAGTALNVMEQGAGSLTFPSGMSAVSTSLECLLQAGDHVVHVLGYASI